MTNNSIPITSIEFNRLVSILKIFLFPENRKFLSALQHKDIDWEKICRQASAHGVLPICYHVAANSGSSFQHEQVDTYLKPLFLRIVQNNLLLASELTRLSRLFKEHHIDILPYKGPLLAESIYGDVSLRQFGDLDILIRSEDAEPAIKLLEGIGYEIKHRIIDMPKLIEIQSPVRSTWECSLIKVDGGILVELQPVIENQQLGVLPSFDELWQNSREIVLFGLSIKEMSSETLLLALCDHGCRHTWNRLIWLMDVARFVQTQPVNWENIFQLANSRGALRVILVSLLLVKKIFELPLPEAVETEISRYPAVDSLSDIFLQKIYFLDTGNSDPHDGLETAMLLANLRDGWKYKRWHYAHILNLALSPTNKEISLIRLPDSLNKLYCLLRPIRLFIKYLPYFIASTKREKI